MFGKAFASMYKGSLMGAGCPVFAVWGYVIANMQPDVVVGCQVELNPKYLAAVIGDSEETMQTAIEALCAPDPNSRTPTDEGRRLIKIGQFDYRVVNGVKYLEIRNEEDRREKNRIRQQEHRAKKPRKKVVKKGPTERENRYVKAAENGAPPEALAQIAAEGTEKVKI